MTKRKEERHNQSGLLKSLIVILIQTVKLTLLLEQIVLQI